MFEYMLVDKLWKAPKMAREIEIAEVVPSFIFPVFDYKGAVRDSIIVTHVMSPSSSSSSSHSTPPRLVVVVTGANGQVTLSLLVHNFDC